MLYLEELKCPFKNEEKEKKEKKKKNEESGSFYLFLSEHWSEVIIFGELWGTGLWAKGSRFCAYCI